MFVVHVRIVKPKLLFISPFTLFLDTVKMSATSGVGVAPASEAPHTNTQPLISPVTLTDLPVADSNVTDVENAVHEAGERWREVGRFMCTEYNEIYFSP